MEDTDVVQTPETENARSLRQQEVRGITLSRSNVFYCVTCYAY